MISYFKYTGGESFALSGKDYAGLFTVQDGKAYTGKSFTSTSVLLSSKGTFLANAFLGEKEFDRTIVMPNAKTAIQKPHITPKGVIDQVFLHKNLGILNDNNLNLYALNILSNTDVIKFGNASQDGGTYMLGLSSLQESKLTDNPDDVPVLAKNNAFPINILPFKSILETSDGVLVNKENVPATLENISELDDSTDSELIVSPDETFTYFIVTPTNSYSFSGSFVKDSTFTFLEDLTDQIPGGTTIEFDNNTNTIYNLGEADGNSVMYSYDFNFYNTCGSFRVRDIMTFERPVIKGQFKVGNELLGVLTYSDYWTNPETFSTPEEAIARSSELSASGKAACTGYHTHTAEDGTVLYMPCSTMDEYNVKAAENAKVGVELSNKESHDFYGFITTVLPTEKIVAFDVRDTDDSILILTTSTVTNRYYNVYHLDAEDIKNIGPNTSPKRVDKLTPTGLNYDSLDKSVTISFAKNDSNMFILNNKGVVTTRFISNPTWPAGFFGKQNLQLLGQQNFTSTVEAFGSSRLAWNTGDLDSNTFTYKNFLMDENGGNIYYLLHNVGRIYLSKSSELIYRNLVPLDLLNVYDTKPFCESSLGVSLNSEIQSILKDSLAIFVNLAIIVSGTRIQGVPVLGKYTSYPNIGIDFRDFEFHENEEINYNVVARVFDSLYNLQRNILYSILNN